MNLSNNESNKLWGQEVVNNLYTVNLINGYYDYINVDILRTISSNIENNNLNCGDYVYQLKPNVLSELYYLLSLILKGTDTQKSIYYANRSLNYIEKLNITSINEARPLIKSFDLYSMKEWLKNHNGT